MSAAASIIEKVGPEIIKDPEDAEARIGDKVQLTVEAEGEGLTYQWQFSANGGTSWTNNKTMAGYNTATITINVNTATRFSQIWRCVVTDENGRTAESAGAAIIKKTQYNDGFFVYKLTEDESGLILQQYTGNEASVIVPEVFDGLPIVQIGEGAFENNSLCSIDLPDSITIIGKCAFKGCTNLKEMN